MKAHSQGSIATHLMCHGMFSKLNSIITKLSGPPCRVRWHIQLLQHTQAVDYAAMKIAYKSNASIGLYCNSAELLYILYILYYINIIAARQQHIVGVI